MTEQSASEIESLGTSARTTISTSTRAVPSELQEGHFIVPESLVDEEIWIVFRLEYRGDDIAKVPKAPRFAHGSGLFNTSPTSTEHATTFEEAMDFVDESRERLGDDGADGVGFIIDGDSDVVGVDIDKAFDATTGEIEQWALDVVEALESFTEVSPSGTGLHVLCRGELDDSFGNRHDELGLEMYESDRYFTFTGRHIEVTQVELKLRTRELRGVQEALMDRTIVGESDSSGETESAPTFDDIDVNEETADVLESDVNVDSSGGLTSIGRKRANGRSSSQKERIVEKACESDDEFARLWNGNMSGYADDPSRADQALANKLSFWCASDLQLMDEIFRQSGLMRPKWGEKRGNSTYGRLTLEKSLRMNPEDRRFDV